MLALAVVELRYMHSRIRKCLDMSCLLGVDIGRLVSLLLVGLRKRLFNLKLRLNVAINPRSVFVTFMSSSCSGIKDE